MSDTLLGVLIGGGLTLLGVIITNFLNRKNLHLQLEHQKQMESAKLRLAKLEELHTLIGAYIVTSNTSFVGFIVQQSIEEITHLRFYEFIESLLKPVSTIGTLINIYIPELSENYENLLVALNEVNFLGAKILDEKKPLALLFEKTTPIVSQCEIMLAQIEKKSREQIPLQVNQSEK